MADIVIAALLISTILICLLMEASSKCPELDELEKEALWEEEAEWAVILAHCCVCGDDFNGSEEQIVCPGCLKS